MLRLDCEAWLRESPKTPRQAPRMVQDGLALLVSMNLGPLPVHANRALTVQRLHVHQARRDLGDVVRDTRLQGGEAIGPQAAQSVGSRTVVVGVYFPVEGAGTIKVDAMK